MKRLYFGHVAPKSQHCRFWLTKIQVIRWNGIINLRTREENSKAISVPKKTYRPGICAFFFVIPRGNGVPPPPPYLKGTVRSHGLRTGYQSKSFNGILGKTLYDRFVVYLWRASGPSQSLCRPVAKKRISRTQGFQESIFKVFAFFTLLHEYHLS